MSETIDGYHSFLLRLWTVSTESGPAWRASLEDPRTGERFGFASLERLFAFLQDQRPDFAFTKGKPVPGDGAHPESRAAE